MVFRIFFGGMEFSNVDPDLRIVCAQNYFTAIQLNNNEVK